MTDWSNNLPPVYRSSHASAATREGKKGAKGAQSRQPILSRDADVNGLVGSMKKLSLRGKKGEEKRKLKPRNTALNKPRSSKKMGKVKSSNVYNGGLPASYPKTTYGQGRIGPGAKMEERDTFFGIWGGPAGSA